MIHILSGKKTCFGRHLKYLSLLSSRWNEPNLYPTHREQAIMKATPWRREGRTLEGRKPCSSGRYQNWGCPCELVSPLAREAVGLRESNLPEELGEADLYASVMCRRALQPWGKDRKRLFSFFVLKFPGWEKSQTVVAHNPPLTFIAKCQCTTLNLRQQVGQWVHRHSGNSSHFVFFKVYMNNLAFH